MSHLGNTHSSLNVNSLRDLARKELTNVLDSVCYFQNKKLLFNKLTYLLTTYLEK